MLRDRAFILYRLKKLQKPGEKGRGAKRSPVHIIAHLLTLAERSIRERDKREASIPKVSYPEELPITAKKDEIITAIRDNHVVIISGETGSGKSTQIPKMCIDAGRGITGRIGCTQPRRIAASSISRRIAEELNEPLGKSVGYKVRFTDKTSPDACIKVMTDGILLAETQGDAFLYDYDTLIIDEAHERSLNIDFILGILRTLIPKRPELKVIITSATLDTEKFSKAFNNAPVIHVSGRLYPVEVIYNPIDPDLEEKGEITYVDLALQTIDELKEKRERGDILVFMPTEQDILETCDRLSGRNYRDNPVILPLFARLPASMQQRIYSVKTGKIVVATNVAETSLTIPGIRYVIDTGLARIARYLPRTRTNSLPVSHISKSSADQRKGRAGRVQSGVCIRLYSEKDYENREEFTPPEILRSNLAEVILRMIDLRLGEPARFPFIDPPGEKSIKDGFDLLNELGAIVKRQGRILLTEKGSLMAAMPLDPRISRMMIEACKEGFVEEAAVIAGILSIQDPRERPLEKAALADQMHAPFKDTDSDFFTMLKIWKQYHREWKELKTQNRMRKFCKDHFLSFPRMREWAYTYDQIMTIIKDQKIPVTKAPEKMDSLSRYAGVHRAILSGFLSNIAVLKEKNIYRATRGREVMVFPGSALFNKNPQWIVASEIVKTSRLFARNVAKIDPAWLETIGQGLCTYSYSDPHWEKKRGEVRALETVSLYGLPVVTGRSVSYGRINPEESHEIFVRSALIENDIAQKFPFLEHNMNLLKELENMENKLRRRDLLADEDALAAFYSERLENICDSRSLARMIRENGSDDFLKMTDKDILLAMPDTDDLTLFPDELTIGNVSLSVSYSFSPGKEDDGLTIKVPSHIASSLSPEHLEWGVDGFLEEKLTALIKGLPKRYRKLFVPVSNTVDIIMKEMKTGEESLINTISKFIYNRFKVSIPASVWEEVEIPEYLRTRITITDNRGKELKTGRNIHEILKTHSSQHADINQFTELKERWERKGIKEWTFDTIPESIETGTPVVLYPALEPDSEKVNMKLYQDKAVALKVHCEGVQELLKTRLAKDIRFLKRDWPFYKEASRAAVYFGGEAILSNLMHEAVMKRLFRKNIRSVEEFDRYINELPALMLEEYRKLRDQALVIIMAYSSTRGLIDEMIKSKRTIQAGIMLCTQIRHQAEWLVPHNFADIYSPGIMREIPRYLKAMEVRLTRGLNNLEKDALKAKSFDEYENILKQISETISPYASAEKKEGMEQLRWMIEEYRVSVFAPELGTAFPISAKRLKNQIEMVKSIV
ncbi:MAG: ATP-dependent RNA helicase HrpA [Deltaproteobacteria bacterium]|nr:ATP-dependent RNA helicase HrpA [Deltaproteobacteria bacterium]